MNAARFVLCCVIVCSMSLGLEASPCTRNDIDESTRNTSRFEDTDRGWIERITGLKVTYDNRELVFRYSRHGEAMEGRALKREKRESIMKRIGTFMAMIPVGMQLLQLPMAIASVKASLLKSLLIAKVAIFMLFLRLLFTAKPHQKVVVLKSPPPSDFHQHYYHPFEDPEDNKPGWLGKGPAWMTSK